ncbi:MAG: hypothetical protein AAFX94_12055, partial [Myxococcota bacterium]
MGITLGVVLKRQHPSAGEAFEHVRRSVADARFVTVEPDDTPLPDGIERVSQEEFARSDLVVVLGGDGVSSGSTVTKRASATLRRTCSKAS